ncbi:MAG: hypothetical protein NC416_08795 [Eubacterium sp.]|nr:hypothetical protein [Eubacterium sp.]
MERSCRLSVRQRRYRFSSAGSSDSYVSRVKNLPEVEAGYMTLGDWIDGIVDDAKEDMREELIKEITEEIREETKEQDIRIMIELCQEYHDTKENAVNKLCTKFPEYTENAEELVDKYWQESLMHIVHDKG